MPNLLKEELTKERTPQALLDWAKNKIIKIGEKDRCKEKELYKTLVEEVFPLGLFAVAKYGNDNTVTLKPVIGKNYDAILSLKDKINPKQEIRIELTQAFDGYQTDCQNRLRKSNGFVCTSAKISKFGTNNSEEGGLIDYEKPDPDNPSWPKNCLTSVEGQNTTQLDLIYQILQKKLRKNYENTILVCFFKNKLTELNKNKVEEHIEELLDQLRENFEQVYVLDITNEINTNLMQIS